VDELDQDLRDKWRKLLFRPPDWNKIIRGE